MIYWTSRWKYLEPSQPGWMSRLSTSKLARNLMLKISHEKKSHYVRLKARVFAKLFRPMLEVTMSRMSKDRPGSRPLSNSTLVISQTSDQRRHLISRLNRCNKLILFEFFAFFLVKVKKRIFQFQFSLSKRLEENCETERSKITYTHDFAHRYFLIQMIYLCWQTYLHIYLWCLQLEILFPQT